MRVGFALILLAACGGKSTPLTPVTARTTLAEERAGVGQTVALEARWDGQCMGRVRVRRENCRPEDHPISQCEDWSDEKVEHTCSQKNFAIDVRCEPNCLVLAGHPQGNTAHVIGMRAGRVTVSTQLDELVGDNEQAMTTNTIEVIDPEPGSLAVTCYSTFEYPSSYETVPCTDARAMGFTVDARADEAKYAVHVVEIDGRALKAAKEGKVDGAWRSLFLIGGFAGPVKIHVGAESTTADFGAAR